MSKPELYLSTDVETDGKIPGQHSMRSLATVAFVVGNNGKPDIKGEFSQNLEPLPGATTHPDTMAFWAQYPDAWAKATENAIPPQPAIADYYEWLMGFKQHYQLAFAGYPVAHEFMWVYWHLIYFKDECPFSHSGLDIKTYGAALLGCGYKDASKRKLPKRWFNPELKHTHIALDDAREQAYLLASMMAGRASLGRLIEEGNRHG